MKLVSKKSKKDLMFSLKTSNEVNPVEVLDVGGLEVLTNVAPNESVSIEDFLQKSEEMQSYCMDNVVPIRFCEVLDFSDGKGIPEYHLDFVGTNDNDECFISTFTKHSLSQLGMRYGISSSYIQRCTNAGMRELVCKNFNEWIDIDKGNVFIRRYKSPVDDKDYVRGILSTKYKSYDAHKIVSAVFNSPVNDWELRQYLLTPERLHMRLVSGEKLKVNGEDLEIGLNIDSSDVGRNSLNLQLIIFRQICSNGLILPYSVGNYYRQVHTGIGAEEFPERIVAKLNEISKVKEIAEKMINKTMDVIELPFDIESEDEIVRFRQYSGVTKDFLNKVIELYKTRKSDSPRWEFINCMTEVAQEYGIDSRLQFERAAGSLLVAA